MEFIFLHGPSVSNRWNQRILEQHQEFPRVVKVFYPQSRSEKEKKTYFTVCTLPKLYLGGKLRRNSKVLLIRFYHPATDVSFCHQSSHSPFQPCWWLHQKDVRLSCLFMWLKMVWKENSVFVNYWKLSLRLTVF